MYRELELLGFNCCCLPILRKTEIVVECDGGHVPLKDNYCANTQFVRTKMVKED